MEESLVAAKTPSMATGKGVAAGLVEVEDGCGLGLRNTYLHGSCDISDVEDARGLVKGMVGNDWDYHRLKKNLRLHGAVLDLFDA